MGLSAFDFAASFLGGVQERAQEYDEALATRIKELADKGPSDITKTKYAEDYKNYTADKKLAQAITSAGIDSDRGQMLAGGYKTMKDYYDARSKDSSLYHEMFTLGEEPTYTTADYGLTNVRDDGSQVTTAGQMFDQFFRPDVHKERIGELTPTPTKESYTSYRRTVDAEGNQLNPRDPEDIEKSREAVKSRAEALQSAGYRDELPDELEVNGLDEDKNSIKQKYIKIPNPSTEYLKSEAGLAAEKAVGLPGYQKVGEPIFTQNTELAQKLRDLGAKPEDGDAEVLADWTYKHNTLVYGATMADKIERDGRPKIGTVIKGLYNKDDKEVSIRYTENPDDIFMEGTDFEMTGWIQIGKAKPDETPTIGSTLDVYDAETDTVQQVQYVGGTVSFEGMEGYEKVGDATPVKDSKNLQTSYNDEGEEVKILYTGNAKHSFEGREGWQQIGEAKATTASQLSSADLKWQPMQIIVDAIKSGGVVSEQQLEAAAFIRAQGDTAMELQFSAVLKDWDRITIMVRDLSYKTIAIVKMVDGKIVDTGGRVKGTQQNIKEQAHNSGMSEREYREQLLGLN